MIISKEEITELIKSIYNYTHNYKRNMIDIILANEINSANYINGYYKLDSLYQHDYKDFHFKINDDKFDVFVYNNEELNQENLLQVILCNNYIEINQFSQGNYDHKKKVCYFHNTTHIYSFFDHSVIVIHNGNSDCEYIPVD